MKKIKLIIQSGNDIFIKDGQLINTTFIGHNPLTAIETELMSYGISPEEKITYLGTVVGTYILSVNVSAEFQNSSLEKIDLQQQLLNSASTNVEDYSALSLSVIKSLNVTNIVKQS